MARFSRTLLMLLAAFLVIGGAAFAATSYQVASSAISTLNNVSSDPLRDLVVPITVPTTTVGATTFTGNGLAAHFGRNERVNLLLLGYGGAGHDGAYLSDSLMLVSIAPATRQVTLISLPRDLWVDVPKGKYNQPYESKINAAFSSGASRDDRDEGMRLAASVVSEVTGLRIDRTVALDFRAFRTVVDALGGIEVPVERAFEAQYPKNDDPDIDASWITISFKSGMQHMDGETAIRFSRARYSDSVEGTDFARAARQQKVIVAAKNKALASKDLNQMLALLASLKDNVRTDLSISDMQALYEFGKNYNDAQTVRATLTNQNVLVDSISQVGAYILLARADTWGQVHQYVQIALQYSPLLSGEHPVVVRTDPSHAALGENAVRRLNDLGFKARFETSIRPSLQSSLIHVPSGGNSTESAFLAEYFHGLTTDSGADSEMVVELGTSWQMIPDSVVTPFVPEEVVPRPGAPRETVPASGTPTATPTKSPTASVTPSGTPLATPTVGSPTPTPSAPLRTPPPSVLPSPSPKR